MDYLLASYYQSWTILAMVSVVGKYYTAQYVLIDLVTKRRDDLDRSMDSGILLNDLPKALNYIPHDLLHGENTCWPKQSKIDDPQAISQILHIDYQIVCCIETYLIHIYHMSKCSKSNWNRYIEGFCMWNVHFPHKLVIPKYHLCYLNELTFNGNLFSLLNYWLFSLQFSYHI